jgi:phosphorylcholine metabolism protein LicD
LLQQDIFLKFFFLPLFSLEPNVMVSYFGWRLKITKISVVKKLFDFFHTWLIYWRRQLKFYLISIIGSFNSWIIYLRREPEAKRNNIKAGKQIPFLSKMNCILISSCFGSCKQWFYPFNPYSSLLTLLRWIMF